MKIEFKESSSAVVACLVYTLNSFSRAFIHEQRAPVVELTRNLHPKWLHHYLFVCANIGALAHIYQKDHNMMMMLHATPR